MAKVLKRIDAGGQQVVALYNRNERRDTLTQRAAKTKASSEALKRMNQIYSWQKLELLLSTTFPTAGSALVIELTYDNDHMPPDRIHAARKLAYWRQKMSAARKAAGLPDLVAVWNIEVLTSTSGRWHHHIVINNTGNDYEMIRSCWGYGQDIEIQPLKIDDTHSWESLAKYLTKESRDCQDSTSRVGQRGWSCTRNCLRPVTETVIVDDDYQLEPPEGSTVLMDERKSTEWASYHVIKYRWIPAAGAAVKPRARHRNRKK